MRTPSAMVAQAGGLPIRVASKSVRCVEVLRRVLAMPGYAGVLAFTPAEAVHLADAGRDRRPARGLPQRRPRRVGGRRAPGRRRSTRPDRADGRLGRRCGLRVGRCGRGGRPAAGGDRCRHRVAPGSRGHRRRAPVTGAHTRGCGRAGSCARRRRAPRARRDDGLRRADRRPRRRRARQGVAQCRGPPHAVRVAARAGRAAAARGGRCASRGRTWWRLVGARQRRRHREPVADRRHRCGDRARRRLGALRARRSSTATARCTCGRRPCSRCPSCGAPARVW